MDYLLVKSLFLWLKYKVQYYVSFRCTTQWFDICMCYKKINMMSNNCLLPYKVIYYYILSSMFLMLYVSSPWLTYFIAGGLYYWSHSPISHTLSQFFPLLWQTSICCLYLRVTLFCLFCFVRLRSYGVYLSLSELLHLA